MGLICEKMTRKRSITYVHMDDEISVYVDICLIVGSLFSGTSDDWKVEIQMKGRCLLDSL